MFNSSFIYRLSYFLGALVLAGCANTINHADNDSFIVVPLGTKGGLIESNLSSYLITTTDSDNFIAFDAGTVLAGLREANKQGSLQFINQPENDPTSKESYVLQKHIKAYAISHAHFDHVAGMVINSTDDSKKPILGLPSTIEHFRDHIFNWQVWPNFTNEGNGYHLNKYQYIHLKPHQTYEVNNTNMTITPFKLSHSNHTSTAFLIKAFDNFLLYFGDVGPDQIEKSQGIEEVWHVIAPLIRNNSLKGIFLEASFPSERADHLLFGHLTPKWMMIELNKLANIVDPKNSETALKSLKVIVTHIKPNLSQRHKNEAIIMAELAEFNDLGIEFILPKQGQKLFF